MSYSLAPGISFGIAADCAVLLDLKHDRYRRLGPPLTAALLAIASETQIDRSSVRALVEAGVVVDSCDGCSIAPVTLNPVMRSALEIDRSDAAVVGPLRVLIAMIRTRAGLKLAGLSPAIAQMRHLRDHTRMAPSAERAAAVAQCFASGRRWFPFDRACVPDALALSWLLCGAGIAHDVAFGVRFDPFTAHAWVQTDTLVLSDPVGAIADLVAVFRL